MLRQGAKREAQPGGAAPVALSSSARGRSSRRPYLREKSALSCPANAPLLSLLFTSLRAPDSATARSSPGLRSNRRRSAGGAAAVTCPQVARTCVQSVTRVARPGRWAGGRRRPKKSPSSAAGRRAATTMPTRRNRATATSATTSNRSTAAERTPDAREDATPAPPPCCGRPGPVDAPPILTDQLTWN